jgi:hypothetical protein
MEARKSVLKEMCGGGKKNMSYSVVLRPLEYKDVGLKIRNAM